MKYFFVKTMKISTFKLIYCFFLVYLIPSLTFSKSEFYSLDMENVNLYWHRTAIMTLLRVKANSIIKLKGFPHLEKLIFFQCNKEAKTPSQLAKCVTTLLDTRDQINYQNGYISEEMRHEELRQKFLNDLKYLFNIDGFEKQKEVAKSKSLKPVKEYYFYKRKKRNITPKYKNLENLKIVQKYVKLTEKCHKYLNNIKNANENFLKRMQITVDHKEDIAEANMMKDILNIVQAFQTDNFAILSPRILPFMPSHDKRRKLISPTLLSFNNDGVLPLPEILKSTNADKREQEAWLDMLLDISGTSTKLESLVKKLEPTISYLEEKVYPAVKKMEALEENYALMKKKLSAEQRYSLAKEGYAFLNPEQLLLIYGEAGVLNMSTVIKCSKVALETKLEEDIRKLARFDKDLEHQMRRFKRDDDDDDDDDDGNNNTGGNSTIPEGENNSNNTEPERPEEGEGEGEEMWPQLRVLRPWAFLNRIDEGIVLEAVILSPHAFFSEIRTPEFMVLDVLSPRAFQPAILSPAALLTRILSPLAFGAEVLSPRAFVAYILSPEAFTAEVLSPQFFEAHILSPETFNVQILSPNIVGPRIGSPESNSILILSPNILSPRILSKERMMIEILSPHVLGGEETEEEEESNLHSESELPEAHKYHNHSRGRFGPPGTEHEHSSPISFFPFG